MVTINWKWIGTEASGGKGLIVGKFNNVCSSSILNDLLIVLFVQYSLKVQKIRMKVQKGQYIRKPMAKILMNVERKIWCYN